MSELSEVERKKRVRTEMMKDEPEEKTPENYKASEEEIKNRRFVRVIRSSESKSENQQKGKFQFLSGIPTTNTTDTEKQKEDKTESTNKKESVNENEIKKGKSDETAKDNPDLPTFNFQNKKMNFGQNPFSQLTKINVNQAEKKPFEFVNPFGHVGKNPFAADNKKTFDINSNPFLKSQNSSTNPPQQSSANLNFFTKKPTFVFNLNAKEVTPKLKSDDEDETEGDNIENNPEEEVKIEGKNINRPEVVVPQSTNPKAIKIALEDLSVYNFDEKKYNSKGKGDLSIELIKTDKDNIMAVCVYRNSTFAALFKANIIKNVTNCESVMKNYKYYALLKKVISINESTKKNEVKTVKLQFISEKDSQNFMDKFKLSQQILEKNDLSLLTQTSVKENEKSEDKEIKKSEEENK